MLSEQKCLFPGCGAKATLTFEVQSFGNKNLRANLPFCEYHTLIVMGGQFRAKSHLDPETEIISWEVVGPLYEVQIIEQVLAAREKMAEKYKEKTKELK